jgi:hypothetical protein
MRQAIERTKPAIVKGTGKDLSGGEEVKLCYKTFIQCVPLELYPVGQSLRQMALRKRKPLVQLRQTLALVQLKQFCVEHAVQTRLTTLALV